MIKIIIPTIEPKEGRIDELISGNYLISKIKHVISSEQSQYNTAMEIVSDSFANPLPVKA